ncbi:Sec1 family protein [Gregarina niphandrodes]|uniref:Sec1 family protein n=1 Tax=Gregarina niphandrodes TaxID=110365 RepID=A0A023BAT4_GRENI|nr:Sec1 family protein [Gregarina niphandrodes]EZG78618.1 Sec1 family protein [Gregarina niphandrodes]|eukprot:XP_011129238.1 Sec1 family protein [Gregarina niphandrodes]
MYQAVGDCLKDSLGRKSIKVIIADDRALRILNAFVSFSDLLRAGVVDVLVLGRETSGRETIGPETSNTISVAEAMPKLNPSIEVLCYIVPSSLNLVEKEIFSHSADCRRRLKIMFIDKPGDGVLERLARLDAERCLVEKVEFLPINFVMITDNVFSAGLIQSKVQRARDGGRTLPVDPSDWSSQDHHNIREGIRSCISFSMVANTLFGCQVQDVPFVLINSSSKAAHAASSVFLRDWESTTGGSGIATGGSGIATGGSGIATGARGALVILDRSDDPIIGLLSPWSYQAMIYEYLQVENNSVIFEDGSQVNLKDDPFLKEHGNDSYGALATTLTTAAQSRAASALAASNHPGLPNPLSNSVGGLPNPGQSNSDVYTSDLSTPLKTVTTDLQDINKHVKIMHAITQQLNTRHTFDLWEIETQILRSPMFPNARANTLSLIEQMVADPRYFETDKKRLVTLYAYITQLNGDAIPQTINGLSDCKLQQWTYQVQQSRPLQVNCTASKIVDAVGQLINSKGTERT